MLNYKICNGTRHFEWILANSIGLKYIGTVMPEEKHSSLSTRTITIGLKRAENVLPIIQKPMSDLISRSYLSRYIVPKPYYKLWNNRTGHT